MMATSTELLQMVSDLDSVDFSSIKSSFHSHFGIHRYFVLLVCLPNVICMRVLFRKKIWRLEVSIGHFAVVGLLSKALVMSEREVEVNLVLIQTSSLF